MSVPDRTIGHIAGEGSPAGFSKPMIPNPDAAGMIGVLPGGKGGENRPGDRAPGLIAS